MSIEDTFYLIKCDWLVKWNEVHQQFMIYNVQPDYGCSATEINLRTMPWPLEISKWSWPGIRKHEKSHKLNFINPI